MSSSSSTTSTNNLQEHTGLNYGISVEGFRTLLAERPPICAAESVKKWWHLHWAHMTLPPNYIMETDASGGEDVPRIHTYTNLTTGEKTDTCPDGTRRMTEVLMEGDRKQHVNTATHFLSYPYTAPFGDLIDMVEIAVEKYERVFNKVAYIYMWVDHPGLNMSSPQAWISNVYKSIEQMEGGLLCANTNWTEPNHLQRSWMLYEAYVTVAVGRPLALALNVEESRKLADHLREHGAETILNIVSQLEAVPEKAASVVPLDTNKILIPEMRRLARATFPNADNPNHKMSLALANATRKSYAEAADRVYRIDIANTAAMQNNLSFAAKTIDLGHQIALLHDITGNLSRAEEIYLEILPFIPFDVVFANIPIDLQDCRTERHKEIRNHHKVAARDKTVAELASVLRQQHKHDAADAAIKHWLQSELPLSFRGVSVTFLENFVQEHNQDLNWLSTNACVERLIKPKTKGQALIELTPHDCIGPKNAKDDHFIFVSHAWLQNFHISGNEWKGGLIQAIVDNTLEHLKAKTYVWLDLFSINQHQTTMAFGFDPLRNVIKEVNEVNINLQTWDDSLPLTRVWCLEEMHNAILFGKEVSKANGAL